MLEKLGVAHTHAHVIQGPGPGSAGNAASPAPGLTSGGKESPRWSPGGHAPARPHMSTAEYLRTHAARDAGPATLAHCRPAPRGDPQVERTGCLQKGSSSTTAHGLWKAHAAANGKMVTRVGLRVERVLALGFQAL